MSKNSIPNPSDPGQPLRPVQELEGLTDRRKRQLANSPQFQPDPPRLCILCGRRSNNARTVFVGHIDGNEAHLTPQNLAWMCRSCNNGLAVVHKSLGLGKRTNQNNPSTGRLPYDPNRGAAPANNWREWVQLLFIVRGHQPATSGRGMTVEDAIDRIQSTPPGDRAKYAAEVWEKRRRRGTASTVGWDLSEADLV